MIVSSLTTNRLHLVRPPAARHFPAFFGFYGSARAASRGWLRNTDEAKAFWDLLEQHWEDNGFGWFVIEEAALGQPIGMCGPWTSSVMPEGEIAWSLWEDRVEGKGLAFEAATAARDFTFGTLGWATAVSYISYDNRRSIALAQRLGAVEDGQWITPKGVAVAVYRHPAPGAAA